jgi:hypothetical protein
MAIDWNVVATGIAAPVAVVLAKTLLDFNLARGLVKYLGVIPFRGIFRDKPPKLAGTWGHAWGSAGSTDFEAPADRTHITKLRQFGRYVYGEFEAKGVTYNLLGRIQSGYLVGDWKDSKDELAYFGSFQLRILDGRTMRGKYVGHSKAKGVVQGDDWHWTKST